MMPYVLATPELMSTAATDLATIGSDLDAAHTAAATHTTGLAPAAADEVSAGVAALFSGYAKDFQTLAGKASVFHGQFVGNLAAGAQSYAGAEAANALANIIDRIVVPTGTLNAIVANAQAFVGVIRETPPGDLLRLALADTGVVLVIALFWIIGIPIAIAGWFLHLLLPNFFP